MEPYLAQFQSISVVALVAATVATVLVGSAWYSHLLFGKAWMRLSGIRFNDISKRDAQRGYLFGSIVALVQATLLAVIIEHVGGHWGAILGAIAVIWLFVALELYHRCLWAKEPFALFLLHAFRALFALLAAACVYLLVRAI